MEAEPFMFDVLPLYNANLLASERVVVNQGGTSSGKTYSIMQVLFMLGMQKPRQVITVVGQDVPNLKKGAYRDAKTILESSPSLQSWWPYINEGERIIKCINGSIIEFSSFKDAQDAKSGKRHYLFINEANGISYEIYWQLAIRTRVRIFIDYNPTARFWVHDELIGRKGVRLIISDHRRNFFLTDEEHARIEGIEDRELWKVYARGLTGMITGLVLTNWDICDELPPHEEWKMSALGLDFGFTCFKGDTLIMTSEGEKAIKDVEVGDYVLTRKGYHRVKRNIYNGYKKVIHKKFVKGLHSSDIFCTFEHNFNANGKWKKYGELTTEDRLFMLSNSTAWSLGDTQTANTGIITTVNGRRTGWKNISSFISIFTKSITESCRRAWSFTTRILIRSTMTSVILLPSLLRNICGFMQTLSNGRQRMGMSSRNDVIQKITGSKGGQRCCLTSQMSGGSANGVERNIHRQTPTKDSVPSHVITNGSTKHLRTISRWFASIVERLSWVTSILNPNAVLRNAHILWQRPDEIITIEDELSDVYDLEIDGVHEYFANGILVHNCDPTAMEHVVLAHGDLYVDELIYSTNLTNPDIAEKAKGAGVKREDQIIADCAEPKSIRELQAAGLWVSASPKGADSIISGLDILKRYRIHVTRRSRGIIANMRSYQWGKDKDGNMTNKPEDRNNHGIDAIRYVALAKLPQRREMRGVRVRY